MLRSLARLSAQAKPPVGADALSNVAAVEIQHHAGEMRASACALQLA